MVVRSPLVRINGRNQQLPPGDTLSGMPLRLTVYRADDSPVVMAMGSGSLLPVMTAAGTVVQLELTNG